MSLMRTTKNTEYITPEHIKRRFEAYYDPCPINSKFDGLRTPWHRYNFVNPPYNQKVVWIERAIEETIMHGHMTVLLLPVDISTAWFHDLILPHFRIEWIRGRLKFNGKTPPFGSMLCYIGENIH